MDRADSYSPDVGFKTLNNANLYETYILSMAMSNCLIHWDDADINLQVIVFWNLNPSFSWSLPTHRFLDRESHKKSHIVQWYETLSLNSHLTGSLSCLFCRTRPWCMYLHRSETTQTFMFQKNTQQMWVQCFEGKTMPFSLTGNFSHSQMALCWDRAL